MVCLQGSAATPGWDFTALTEFPQHFEKNQCGCSETPIEVGGGAIHGQLCRDISLYIYVNKSTHIGNMENFEEVVVGEHKRAA